LTAELVAKAGNGAIAGLLGSSRPTRPASVQRDDARRSPIRTRPSSPHAPKPPPPVVPGSVSEMREMLETAENMLVDPFALSAKERLKIYGTSKPIPEWRPDETGSLARVDYALDFVRPLVDQTNIASHANDERSARWLGLDYTTAWLTGAKDNFDAASRARQSLGAQPDRATLSKVVGDVGNLVGRRSSDKLKVLADEGLSFELELGSSSAPAPEFRPEMRWQLPGGAGLSKRELRVLAWLRNNRKVFDNAEHDFRVDRRAIAAPIAWEAMNNIMRAGLRGVGPGKMHTYSSKWAGVLPLPKGDAMPQQLEEQGYVPQSKTDEDRVQMLTTLLGSVTYIAAAMRAATTIAGKYGYDISHDFVALTSFYQGHDLPSWEDHMRDKKAKREKKFVAADPMAVWTESHLDFLKSGLGTAGFGSEPREVHPVQRHPANHQFGPAPTAADRQQMPSEAEAPALAAELAALDRRLSQGERLNRTELDRRRELQHKVGLRMVGDDEKTLELNGQTGGLDAWFGKVTARTFLGQTVVVHDELAARLKKAEDDLKGEAPPEGGWIDGTVSTLRDPGQGLHAFGLAIDVFPASNPYLLDPPTGAKDTDNSAAEVQAAIERAVLLVQGKTPAEEAWPQRPAEEDKDKRVEASYDKLAGASSALKEYFTLDGAENRQKLERLAEAARDKHPEHRSADEWAAKIAWDRRYVGKIADLIHWSHPERGLLRIDKRLVKALTRSDGAGLTWLGDDKIAGGRDIMHFDTRAVGPIHRIWSSFEGHAIGLGPG
jgi:hypothetical protein